MQSWNRKRFKDKVIGFNGFKNKIMDFFWGGGFPHSSVGKESTYNAGDPGSIPGLGNLLETG